MAFFRQRLQCSSSSHTLKIIRIFIITQQIDVPCAYIDNFTKIIIGVIFLNHALIKCWFGKIEGFLKQ